MIVWGGVSVPLWDTGGRYNPSTDSWTATSTTNAPVGRDVHTAVWTGSEMIVWGGLGGGISFSTPAGDTARLRRVRPPHQSDANPNAHANSDTNSKPYTYSNTHAHPTATPCRGEMCTHAEATPNSGASPVAMEC